MYVLPLTLASRGGLSPVLAALGTKYAEYLVYDIYGDSNTNRIALMNIRILMYGIRFSTIKLPPTSSQ